MRQQDAPTLLDADHKEVEALFEQYKNSTDRGQKEHLARTICTELKVHTQIEEEIFYPAFRAACHDEDLLKDAQNEHDEAKQIIAQIESRGADDALVAKLEKLILHHVKDEREKMFPKSRKSDMDLDGLGARLHRRKLELLEHQPV